MQSAILQGSLRPHTAGNAANNKLVKKFLEENDI